MATPRSNDQKRYQVFVSSTYLDLLDERQAVITTLLESDAFPAGMELFPASDDDAWTLIQGVIQDSDYYLVVIGGKYGSIDPSEDIGFTEKEYDYAASIGKPVMAFLHGDPDALTVEKSEKAEDMQKRLESFREKVKGAKHVKYWSSAEDLAGKVATSFNKVTRQFPAVGWIRADRAASVETLTELAESRKAITDLRSELSAAQSSPPPGTENLAQGDDQVILQFFCRGRFSAARGVVSGSAWVEFILTWNSILGIVAPNMLVDAEESALQATLISTFRTQHYSDINDEIRKNAGGKEPAIKKDAIPTNVQITVDDEGFGTIMLQLKALGLIEKSNRRRSVNDTGTYWTMTPLGEQRAITERAIRRTNDDEPARV